MTAGDRVDKGALLLSLDPTLEKLGLMEAKAASAEAQATLDEARRRRDEARRLGPKKGIPETEIRAAEAGLKIEEAKLERLHTAERYRQELVARQTSRNRFTGWIMGIFALSALLLAMIGIYGVMSYAVSHRTQEIGIRMALGAARSEVLGMVVRSGMITVTIGLALGSPFAVLGATQDG